MKLLNSWTRVLSVGLVAASGACHLHAQGISVPGKPSTTMPVRMASGYQEPVIDPMLSGPMAPMPGPMPMDGASNVGPAPAEFQYSNCDCGDGGCDSLGCGPRLGGRLGPLRGGLVGQGSPNCNDFAQLGNEDLYCQYCGYAGCPRCGWGLGLLAGNRCKGLLGRLVPFSEGGVASQRWYDISVEGTAFKRTKDAGAFNFSSQGAGTNNFVLSSNDAQLDKLRAGLAVSGCLQTGVGSNLEMQYFGLNNWNSNATARAVPANTPTLYSFISNFGTAPVNGFDDSDRSFTHSLAYESAIHNLELNFRRRWVGPYGWFQGSFLGGFRYFDLDERMNFSARGENNNALANNGLRFFDYTVGTKNTLTGFQLGTDLWLNVVPGIKTGVELKGGLFGNQSELDSVINANSLVGFREQQSDGRAAFLGQVSLMTLYRISYSWTLRGSYQYMYIDNVALAPENFNSTPPALILPAAARNVRINNDGEVAYSGFTFGAEYLW